MKYGKIDKIIQSASDLFVERKFTGAIEQLSLAWGALPEKKESQKESYHIAKYLVIAFLKLKKYEEAQIWATKLQNCDLNRLDDGEREFYAGVVQFELKNYDRAKNLLEAANMKSDGNCFEGEDQKYLNLVMRGPLGRVSDK